MCQLCNSAIPSVLTIAIVSATMSLMESTPSLARLPPLALLIASAYFPLQARAQAGPPHVTNDPDTPGDGKWEINLAIAGATTHDTWDLSAPDIDINYGLGERMQLSMHLPWLHQRFDDRTWQSGLGHARPWANTWCCWDRLDGS